MQESRIYNTLENTPRILFWELDEFISFALPLFSSILFSSLLLIPLALVSKYLYKKIKRRHSKVALIHLLYWYLPSYAFSGRLKGIPESHKRDFIQ